MKSEECLQLYCRGSFKCNDALKHAICIHNMISERDASKISSLDTYKSSSSLASHTAFIFSRTFCSSYYLCIETCKTLSSSTLRDWIESPTTSSWHSPIGNGASCSVCVIACFRTSLHWSTNAAWANQIKACPCGSACQESTSTHSGNQNAVFIKLLRIIHTRLFSNAISRIIQRQNTQHN